MLPRNDPPFHLRNWDEHSEKQYCICKISHTVKKLTENKVLFLPFSVFLQAGPTVCQHFYNFLLRLRHLSSDTPWTPCLKEILLRVLSLFLSGPFTSSEFPLDAFNKFLDRLTCPDLSYVNPATVISLMQQMGT
jgi:hypothetical protein